MNSLQSTLQLLQENCFVSIRDIQKSPSKALNAFKIIMNNNKMQGVYIPQEFLDEYIEDLEAICSPTYIEKIKQTRKEKTTPAKKVRQDLDI